MQWVDGRGGRPPLALELRTRDGVWLDIFGQEMPDRGFVISFTDVTAERDAAAALQAVNESLEQRVLERTLALEAALATAERANASKSRFVAAASHDLLQPLSAAKLFLAALENRDGPDPAATLAARAQRLRERREHPRRAARHLPARFRQRDRHALDLPARHAARPARRTSSARSRGRRASTCAWSIPAPWCCSDASYLRRIVQNLLANAVRYTRRRQGAARRPPGARRGAHRGLGHRAGHPPERARARSSASSSGWRPRAAPTAAWGSG